MTKNSLFFEKIYDALFTIFFLQYLKKIAIKKNIKIYDY